MGNLLGKGQNQTTTQTGPNPQAMGAYLQLIQRAQGVSQLPYQTYTGEWVAPVNAQQQAGIGNINANAGFATPYIQQAAQYAQNAAAPITAANINQYMSPYTQDVVNATQGAQNVANQQALNNITGNAVAQGALGGDRADVAKAAYYGAVSPGQQAQIAGLYQQGYGQAEQTALAEQQAQANAAYSMGNLGVAGQNAALQGAGAQLQAGGLEQQTQQALDTALQQEFFRQQGFPYQQTQWLAGLEGGIAPLMGQTQTTVGPQPNQAAQWAGLGLAAAGMFLDRGGRVRSFQEGGGAMPYAGFGGPGYIPTGMPMAIGRAPQISNPASQSAAASPGALQMASQASSLANTFRKNRNQGQFDQTQTMGGDSGPLDLSPAGGLGVGDVSPDMASPEMGFGTGPIFRRGGMVRLGLGMGGSAPARRGFADGGDTLDDRFGAAFDPANQFIRLPEASVAVSSAPADDAPVPADVPLPRARPEEADLPVIDVTHMGLGQPWNPDGVGDVPPLPPETGGAASPARETVGSGVAPPPGVTSTSGPLYAPERPSGLGALADIPSQIGSRLANVSPEARMGIIAAGLGMMASTSPFFFASVGRGGLEGLQTYAQQQQQKQSLDMEAKKLAQQAQIAQDRLKVEMMPYSQMNAAQKAELALKQEQMNRGINLPPGGTLVNPRTGEVIAHNTAGAFDTQTLSDLADQYLAGDKSVFQNLGRGAQGAENIVALRNMVQQRARERGMQPGDIAATMANFGAQSAAARTSAVREANISASIEEAKQTFPMALEASKAVPRTSFVPLNRAIQMVQAGTSSPELARFVTANQAVITAYGQAMSRTGVNTVHAQEAAQHLLSTATSPEAYATVIDQLQREMDAAKVAPEMVRKEILRRISGGGGAQAAPAATPSGQPGRRYEDAVQVLRNNPSPTTRAQFDARYGAGAAARELGQ